MTTCKRQTKNQSGFSLVELMITLAVLGLLASVVVLTLPGSESVARQEAARFAARAAAARDLAVTGQRPMALWVTASGYGFEIRRAGAWKPVETGAFKPHNWPSDVRVEAGGSAGGRVAFDTLGLTGQAMAVTIHAGDAARTVDIGADGAVRFDD